MTSPPNASTWRGLIVLSNQEPTSLWPVIKETVEKFEHGNHMVAKTLFINTTTYDNETFRRRLEIIATSFELKIEKDDTVPEVGFDIA